MDSYNDTSFFFGSRNTTTTPPPVLPREKTLKTQSSKLLALNALDGAWNNVHSENLSRFSSPAPARNVRRDTTNLVVPIPNITTQKPIERKSETVYHDFMLRRRDQSIERRNDARLQPSLRKTSQIPVKTEDDTTKRLLKTIEEQRSEIQRLKARKPTLASAEDKQALQREWKHLGSAIYNSIQELCDLVLLLNPDVHVNAVHKRRSDLVMRIRASLVPPGPHFSPSYLLQGCTILSALLSSHKEDLADYFGRKFPGVSHLESVLEGLEDSVLLDAEFSHQ
jgi:hypothetical protein